MVITGAGLSIGIAAVIGRSPPHTVMIGSSAGVATVTGVIIGERLFEQWTTKAGNLGNIEEREFIEIPVVFNVLDDRPLVYTLQSGKLPKGLKLDPDTGIISGTPFDVDLKTETKFTIRVSDKK